MIQTSWKITRCYYGCNFRLDIVLLNTWVFWVVSGLDATILKTMSAELGMLQKNGRPRDWDFNHTRLRSKTWNSGILPIWCLFSKLRRSYAPFWQKVITVIVSLFPKLKLNKTLRGSDSGVQICCTVKYRLFSASSTFPEFQRVDSNNCQSEKGGNTETEGKQSNGGSTALRRVLVPTQRNMHNNVFSSSTELELPPRWKMVTSD